jgi:hypothetical protein
MPRLTLKHRVTHPERGVTVEVFSFRKLNKQELAAALQEALEGKGQKLKRGAVVKIFATFS